MKRIFFGLALSRFPTQENHEIINRSGIYNFLGLLQEKSLRNNGINKDSIIEKASRKIKIHVFYFEIFKAALKGRFLINYTFCGPHFSNFGHFLLESLSRINITSKKIFFQTMDSSKTHQKILPYQLELINLLTDIKNTKIKLLTNKSYILISCKVTDIEIDFPIRINKNILSKYSKIANKLNSNKFNDRIFISRSKLIESQQRISMEQNIEIEELFKEFDFKIIHPELLKISDQIAIVKNAKILAGNQGSGLHLSIFAPEKCTVVELGDSYQKETPNTMQLLLCEAKNQKFFHINYLNSRFDVTYVKQLLQELIRSGG